MSHRRTGKALTLASIALLVAPITALPQNGDDAVRAALDRAAALLAQSKPQDALTALAPVEAAEPDNPWLWFYRGSAHLQMNEPYRAMDAYDRAQSILRDLGDPDPELTTRIHLHRYRARRQVFRLTFQSGLAYDTNVTYTGAGGTGLGLISGRPDGLFSSDVRLDYAPIATQNEGLTVGARLSHNWHFSVEEFDIQGYGAYARYARTLGERWELALQYDYDMTLLGRDSFLSAHALTPSLAYHWRPTAGPLRADTTKVFYQFSAQDFLDPTDPPYDRDALAHSVGIEQTAQLQPLPGQAWVWDLSAGYRFDPVPTQGSQFDRFSHLFYAGLAIPLVDPARPDRYLIIPDKELVFRFNAQWAIDDYRRRNLLDADRDPRSDYITTLNFGLSQKLLEDPRYGDLTLHGLISWMDANSNVTPRSRTFPYRRSSPFTYDKIVYGVQLEWSW